MSVQFSPSQDVGLHSVLESGLALIRDAPVPGTERDRVLDNLILIFSEADRGARALFAQPSPFAVEERPAFERFALFFHYLKETFGTDLPVRLAEASAAFSDLKGGNNDDNVRRERVAALVEALLSSLQREMSLVPLLGPRTFKYG